MLHSTGRVALVYVRVSTQRQAEEGIGLEAQEAKARAHAERMGWPVAQVFRDEGISGKEGVEHRPGMAALLKAARNTPNAVVVVYSISRLARTQRLLCHLLDEKTGEGLAISSSTEPFDTSTPIGRAMFGMLAVFAQLESDMVSERTKDALAQIKATGRVQLGQKTIQDLAPQTVAIIQALVAQGLSQQNIADELNRRGIPTATGRGKWRKSAVYDAIHGRAGRRRTRLEDGTA